MKAGSPAPFAYDLPLLFAVLFLIGTGIVMVYSASSALALKTFGSDLFFLKRQAVFALIGIVTLIVCCRIPLPVYRTMTYPLLALAFLLLVLIQTTGLGFSAGGSTRWLRVGGFTLQPSEPARLALILYLAYSMSKKQPRIKTFSIGFLPHIIVLALFSVVILIQPDFGSVVILAVITWIMLFVGGARLLHLSSAFAALLPIFYLLMINAEYRLRRIMSFLDPWQYPTDEGYQVVHSLMAFGTGGLFGTGIGNSYQKLFYLPEPHTDFIFSVVGEELGLLGVMVILGLYGIILWRGTHIARNADSTFAMILSTGITVAVLLQVCINMGVALGLLPTKGLTLPFLSYGGSSLIVNMASMGILMNIGAGHMRKAGFHG